MIDSEVLRALPAGALAINLDGIAFATDGRPAALVGLSVAEPDPFAGTWPACSEPERPPDELMTWHLGSCRACVIKAEAVIAQGAPRAPVAAFVLAVYEVASGQ